MVDMVNLEEEEAAMVEAAIQASLRDIQPRVGESSLPNEKVIDLTNDSDDDSDVKELHPKSKSIIGSDSETEVGNDEEPKLVNKLHGNVQPSTQTPVEVPVMQGILGLDRKQMELERLARQNARQSHGQQMESTERPRRQDIRDGKRKAGFSPPLGQSPVKAPRIEATSAPATHHSSSLTNTSFPTRIPAGSIMPTVPVPVPVPAPSSVIPTTKSTPQWLHGIVKKTYLSNIARSGNDITFEELLQASDLKLAVISSFIWDTEWIFNKLKKETKILLVMSVKNLDARRQYREETSRMPNVKLCFPPMEGQINCMHSKLILLFHTEYLRIAVPTANATSHDWGVRGLMENTVFIIDLPKLKSGSELSKTSFQVELEYFLRASTISDLVIERMKGYDFSETSCYEFVHSIGGSHTGDALKRTGFCGLGRAVTRIGMRSLSKINVAYVTSSIGALDQDFLRRIYLACKGDDGLTENPTRQKSVFRKDDAAMTDTADAHMQVYFPSHKTVTEAHENPIDTAGTIMMNKAYWQRAEFPRRVMRDCLSERGTLMHNKLIYAWPDEPITLPNGDECKGWAYVGSHNLSESAWGFRLVKDRATGLKKINLRNYECGVLVPVINANSTLKESAGKGKAPTSESSESGTFTNITREIFNDTVPVPMLLPAPRLTDERKPWFLMEEIAEQDRAMNERRNKMRMGRS
ncbi:hypothetical protein N7495_003079 [Penicillium taxi]|uniref:uncharacterized protein n=1 Tax=Penicillium taxi TaxID=168475 RepID=UPI0025454ED2|nr:uncharacterized protein N7495_003079 [Penicillium taxi]KAJ5902551.1 hypothetical protein N7495_003079 [Penicillium taxi]